ncbi:BRO family protein [Pelistega ratti]|uniref:BRO family protein n=1 Tax=Pelistega ratti TaxID=2652177 RepID=UPI001358C927|nr:BRO family protein [Pelistega ratti]
MSNITTFNFQSNTIQVINKNNEAWFIASEIALIFGYRDASNLVRILDEDEKGTHNMSTLGGTQLALIISESGLYHAAFKSRKQEAQDFRKWVTNEVLPTIRKTGSYTTPTQATIAYEPKTHEVEDEVLHTLSNLLFLAHRQADVLAKLYPALKTMLSQYAAEVYSLYTEPRLSISLSEHRLRKLFTTLAKDDAEWRKTLHHFNEMFPIEKYNARLNRQQALHAIGR